MNQQVIILLYLAEIVNLSAAFDHELLVVCFNHFGQNGLSASLLAEVQRAVLDI